MMSFTSLWCLDCWHCFKSVRIRSYSGLHFPTFEVNTERHEVSLHIQSEWGKMWTIITPNMDTFCAVWLGTDFTYCFGLYGALSK